MKKTEQPDLPDPSMQHVIILKGEHAGEEGYCLGPTHGGLWAVSPQRSDKILALRFDEEFGILINRGQPPGTN